MPEAPAPFRCCDRLAGAAGTACAARAARRRLLKAAVFHHPDDGRPAAQAQAQADGDQLTAEPDLAAANLAAADLAAADLPADLPTDLAAAHGPARSTAAAAGRAGLGFPDAAQLPMAVTGTIVEVSPQVLVVGEEGRERRLTLSASVSAWRGAPLEVTGLRPGDHAVIRLAPSQRGVADRIWANIGRVTGTIIERIRDCLVVDEGATRRRQIVVIPPRAAGRIQVRFPTLRPGYLVDVIGIRRGDELEGLIPATSQPAYPVGRILVSPTLSGHLPAAISGSATWHEPTDEPPGVLGISYPELDPETHCAEYAAAGGVRGYARMPYLAIGSALFVRNDCTGQAAVLPVTGCAPVARLFNDRCVTCGTSPRGRVADLTLASFVALGGELERGCFNATITIGD